MVAVRSNKEMELTPALTPGEGVGHRCGLIEDRRINDTAIICQQFALTPVAAREVRPFRLGLFSAHGTSYDSSSARDLSECR